MPRVRKTKAAPARKRAKRRKTRAKLRENKILEQQSGDRWQIGAGILALTVMLGAAIYAISLNDSTRTSIANFVERFEVPKSASEFSDSAKRNLPDGE